MAGIGLQLGLVRNNVSFIMLSYMWPFSLGSTTQQMEISLWAVQLDFNAPAAAAAVVAAVAVAQHSTAQS